MSYQHAFQREFGQSLMAEGSCNVARRHAFKVTSRVDDCKRGGVRSMFVRTTACIVAVNNLTRVFQLAMRPAYSRGLVISQGSDLRQCACLAQLAPTRSMTSGLRGKIRSQNNRRC